MIEIEFNNQTDADITGVLFQVLAGKIAVCENLKSTLSLSLLLVNSRNMQKLNKTWRGKNAATDVLAFPFNFPAAEFLGDIIIDIETASRQKGKQTLSHELQVLFLHGFLHLLGYDHISESDAVLMRSKENEYRNYIKEQMLDSG
ncbi:MAG: rRNA maturation RNase YbeY [Candidatus Cloacimonetes bacterium]|nr:rRNA maturation RNase YbeY [Candidatus Cloacimonadota bacterium]